MSDVQQDSTPPQRSGLLGGIDWVGKHWPRVRLGHEGMMLDKIQRQSRIVEIDARNSLTGKTDDTEGWPGAETEGEDGMGVKIGDEIHYHAAPESPPSQEQPVVNQGGASNEASSPAADPTWMKLAKWAAIAALPLAGIGGTLAVNALTADEKPPVVEQPAVDRVGGLGIVHGKEPWEK